MKTWKVDGFDIDIFRSLLLNRILMFLCLGLTFWHVSVGNWFYALTTFVSAGVSYGVMRSLYNQQRTRDKVRRLK